MISVIVPVYNAINTLDRCLNSLTRQGIDNLKIILVDDGSNDGSEKKCDDWAEKHGGVTVIHKQNGGLSDARNEGLKAVDTDYVTFVDADDFLQDNSYKELSEVIKQHPEYDIVEFPVFVNFGSKNEQVLKFKKQLFKSFEDYWLKGRGYKHSYAWNKIYKTKLFDSVKFPEGVLFEDLHTMPELMKRAKCLATVNTGVYYYCFNQQGITANADGKALEMMLKAYLNVIEDNPHFINDNDFYMEVVNRQIDVYRTSGKKMGIPHKRIHNIRHFDKKSYRWKARIINVCGVSNLCRIVKLQRKCMIF